MENLAANTPISSSESAFNVPSLPASSTHDDAIHNSIDMIVIRVNLVLCLFGILGNLVCMGVLVQKKLLGRKFNNYLLILAFADFIFSFIVFVDYCVKYHDPERAILDLSWLTCHLTDYITHTLDAFCVFVTLIVSIDRYYAIVQPIKNKTLITNRYPKQISLVCLVIMFLLHSPGVFLSQSKYIYAADNTHQSITRTLDFGPASYRLLGSLNNSSNGRQQNQQQTGSMSSELTMKLFNFNVSKNGLLDQQTTTLNASSLLAKAALQRSSHSKMNGSSSPSILEFMINSERQKLRFSSNKSRNYQSEAKAEQLLVKDFCFFTRVEPFGSAAHKPWGSDPARVAYILYSKLILSLFLNILPAFAILILNSILSYFIRQYTTSSIANSSANSSNPNYTNSNVNANSACVATHLTVRHSHIPLNNISDQKFISRAQKSNYLTISKLFKLFCFTNVGQSPPISTPRHQFVVLKISKSQINYLHMFVSDPRLPGDFQVAFL
jgi:hypothetical protein